VESTEIAGIRSLTGTVRADACTGLDACGRGVGLDAW
jgi:hypothetical protein